jgi:hypothetical protein
MEVAVGRAGWRQGIRAMTWAYEWAVAREALGDEPSVDQVAEYWKMNRRTAFREQSAFREAFPSLDTPAVIYADPRVRETLQGHARFGEKIDELGEKFRRQIDTIVVRVGSVPYSGPEEDEPE